MIQLSDEYVGISYLADTCPTGVSESNDVIRRNNTTGDIIEQ